MSSNLTVIVDNYLYLKKQLSIMIESVIITIPNTIEMQIIITILLAFCIFGVYTFGGDAFSIIKDRNKILPMIRDWWQKQDLNKF